MPTRAQVYLERCNARPDFLYDGDQAAVFVDGPVHDYPDVALRDARAGDRLEDAGYTMIRFPPDDSAWPEIVEGWTSVFGKAR